MNVDTEKEETQLEFNDRPPVEDLPQAQQLVTGNSEIIVSNSQCGSETASSSSYVEGLSEFQSFCEQMIGIGNLQAESAHSDVGGRKTDKLLAMSSTCSEPMDQSPAAFVEIEVEVNTADAKEVAADVQLLPSAIPSISGPLSTAQPIPPPKISRRKKLGASGNGSKSTASASPAAKRARGDEKTTLETVQEIVEDYKEELSNSKPTPPWFVLLCLFCRFKPK